MPVTCLPEGFSIVNCLLTTLVQQKQCVLYMFGPDPLSACSTILPNLPILPMVAVVRLTSGSLPLQLPLDGNAYAFVHCASEWAP